MEIKDLDDFYEKYLEKIEENKTKFTEIIFDILNSEEKYINKKLWLQNWIQQLLELKTNSDSSLSIEKIIARWHWKEIMFLIINYAIKNDINLLKLKAQPLLLKKEEDLDTMQRFLYDFYWYFWFKKEGLYWNMILNFEDFDINTLKILYNRLLEHIEKTKNLENI